MNSVFGEERERSRREFLYLAGSAALAGTTLNARGAEASDGKWEQKSDRVIRLAVVGGGFGASHHWHEHPNCKVTAVSDLIGERRSHLMKSYACDTAFESLEVMLDKAADQFDAVAIFTDGASHTKHAIICLEKGKHVTSAVPACMVLEDAYRLKEAVEKTGLTYMMHESSYYRQPCIAARELYEAGAFGRLAYSEVEYCHPGIGAKSNSLSRWQGLKSWRYGMPPLLYPTHALGLLVGVTKERIVKVSCYGERVGKEFPEASDNRWGNPFDNEIAIGLTDQGNVCRFNGCWQIAAGGERGQWLGEKLSCYMADSAGRPPAMDKHGHGGGYARWEVPNYWETERLPEKMRHPSGHGGSATFLSAEFIDALVENRTPTIDIYESLAMTVPGIVAHQSAMAGGEQLDVPDFDSKGT